MTEWIKTSDRLPLEDTPILLFCGEICTGQYTDQCEWFLTARHDWTWIDDRLVTHWMPLPEPPL